LNAGASGDDLFLDEWLTLLDVGTLLKTTLVVEVLVDELLTSLDHTTLLKTSLVASEEWLSSDVLLSLEETVVVLNDFVVSAWHCRNGRVRK